MQGTTASGGLIGRIIGFAIGVVLFAMALVFASVLALVAGVVVIGVWIYLYWKMRSLARQAPPGATVIEGEYRVERDATVIEHEAPGAKDREPDGRNTRRRDA